MQFRLTRLLITTIPVLIFGIGLSAYGQDIRIRPHLGSEFHPEGTGLSAFSYTFDIYIPAPHTEDIIVTYETFDGTATAGEDYAPAAGTRTIKAGNTITNVTFNLNPDSIYEDDETVGCRLLGTNIGTIVVAEAIGTIVDDDPPPTVIVSNASAFENAGPMTFTISLQAYGQPVTTQKVVTATYATFDGSATTADNDYPATTGTVTFFRYDHEKFVTINPIDDNKVEPDETFTFEITSVSNTATLDFVGNPHIGTGTILNDDIPPPDISIADATGPEGNYNLVFDVTLSHAFNKDIAIDYFTAPLTATYNVDYFEWPARTTFIIPAGDISSKKRLHIGITDDNLEEADEQFLVNLSSASFGTIVKGQATGTIVDGEGPPAITVSGDSVVEGEGPLAFVITLSHPTVNTITVDYSTSGNNAVHGEDYTNASGTLTFAPGATTQTVWVSVIDDDRDEFDETITFTIDNPVSTTNLTGTTPTIATPTAIGTIIDDDPFPIITIDDVVVSESQDAVFTISLGSPSDMAITIDYATSDDTAVSSGAYPDFVAASGTLTIAPGVTSQTITVTVVDDSAKEVQESFDLVLSNPTNASFGNNAATGTILDDDTTPTLTIDNVEVLESDADKIDAIFTVTVTGESEPPMMVDFATVDGTATAGLDYRQTSGTLSWGPHDTTSRTITVVFFDDDIREQAETAIVNLSNPVEATLADDSGLLTILDDDQSQHLIYRVTIRGRDFSEAPAPPRLRTSPRGYMIFDRVEQKATLMYFLREGRGAPIPVVQTWHDDQFEVALTQNNPNGRLRDFAFSSLALNTGTIAAVGNDVLDYEYRYLIGRAAPRRIGADNLVDTPARLRGEIISGDATTGDISQFDAIMTIDNRTTRLVNDQNLTFDQALDIVIDKAGFGSIITTEATTEQVQTADLNDSPSPIISIYSVVVSGSVNGSQQRARFRERGFLIVDRANRQAELILSRVERAGAHFVRLVTSIDLDEQEDFLLNLNSNNRDAIGLINAKDGRTEVLYLMGLEDEFTVDNVSHFFPDTYTGSWLKLNNGDNNQIEDAYSQARVNVRMLKGQTREAAVAGWTFNQIVQTYLEGFTDRRFGAYQEVSYADFCILPPLD